MRYFIEVSYKGTAYAGFQIQQNASTIQSEVERALQIYFKQPVKLTGSSRTDAGVHALQNFFHFDLDVPLTSRLMYNLNAMLPFDIAVKNIYQAAADANARFAALSRQYRYYIYHQKDPLLFDRAYYYPYTIHEDSLHQAAKIILSNTDFTSFAKRNSQVNNHKCIITESAWYQQGQCLVYTIQANRFLRGMVRGLVGTMLKVGRGAINIDEFKAVFEAKDCSKADFSTPGKGLFLSSVVYPANLLQPLSK